MENIVLRFKSMLFCEISKFRLGQILFISGITFGLFLGDGARKAFFIAALLCLTKSQLKEKFYKSLTKGQKIYGCFLLLFCLWIFFIPLFCGIEPLMGRLEGLFRPLEFFIIMWEMLIFAKDEFFFKNIKNFAIMTCFIYSVLAVSQRFILGFPVDFSNWVVLGMAWRVGTLLSGLLPWVVYAFITERSLRKTLFLALVIILTCGTMFLTLYTTFWLVLAVQFAATFLVILLFYRKGLFRICVFTIATLAIIFCLIYSIATYYENFRDNPGGLMEQLEQITSVGDKFEISKFTNRRSELWCIAIELIKKRPMFGYGWADGEMVSDRIGHMHNAFLQAAWNAGIPAAIMYAILLLILCISVIKKIKTNGKLMPISFVVLLAFLAYIVCAMLDDMFRSQRTIMTLYLSTFMLMLTPLANFTPDSKNELSDGKC